MPYTVAIEDRIVHISWEGTVSQEDLEQVDREIPRIAAELRFAPHVLHSFAAVKGRTFAPLDVLALSRQRSMRKIPVPVKAALVVKSVEARRVAEVMMALNRSPNLTMEIFKSERAARAWLAD